jgi:hypothetical protein
VFDLQGGPVTITMPDAGTRFMSLIALDEDHYVRDVAYGRGKRTYTRGTDRHAVRHAGRSHAGQPERPERHESGSRLQDAIRVEQRSRGDLDVPNWDPESQKQIREALLELATTVPDTKGMFGSRDDVDP